MQYNLTAKSFYIFIIPQSFTVILFMSNSVANFLQRLASFMSFISLNFQKNNFIFTFVFHWLTHCLIRLCNYSNKGSWMNSLSMQFSSGVPGSSLQHSLTTESVHIFYRGNGEDWLIHPGYYGPSVRRLSAGYILNHS